MWKKGGEHTKYLRKKMNGAKRRCDLTRCRERVILTVQQQQQELGETERKLGNELLSKVDGGLVGRIRDIVG